MRRLPTIVGLAIAVLLWDSGRAWGQFRAGFLPPPQAGVVRGGGLGFAITGRRVQLTGFIGGWGYRFWGYNGWWGGVPVWSAGWWYPPITTWTPVGWIPGFLPPGWGVGPGWNVGPWGFWPPLWDAPGLIPVAPFGWPLVQNLPEGGLPGAVRAADTVAARPGNFAGGAGINPLVGRAGDAATWNDAALNLPVPEPPREFLVISPQKQKPVAASSFSARRDAPQTEVSPSTMSQPGSTKSTQPFGNYLVISPQTNIPRSPTSTTTVSRTPENLTKPVSTVADDDGIVPALFRVDPFAPRPQLLVDPVDADPRKEAQRWIQRGRAAFIAGEYGRAAQLFATAAEKDPDLPFPRYWQAQAEIAAGRYAHAFAVLRLGLQQHAQAAHRFDPKELYGTHPQRHAEHLAALRRAVADQPQEPILAYLLAWQLWLIGEKAEARRWWERSQQLGGPAEGMVLGPQVFSKGQ